MNMADHALAELLSGRFDARQIALPVDPAVVQRAAAPGAPEHWTAPELAELAGADPVLACHLFRAANAAFYAGLPKVRSLGDAIRRIGLEKAVAVVQVICREGQFPRQARFLETYLAPLSRHALGCALGAGWLAHRCGYPGQAESAYLAGLLHDIGKWLLLAGLARLVAADGDGQAAIGGQLVEEVLACLHVDAGLRLVNEWHLPDELAAAIGCHHQTGLERQELLVALVKLANKGCHKLGLGGAKDSELVLPTSAEAQFLCIDEIALAEFEIMLEDHFRLGWATGVPAPSASES